MATSGISTSSASCQNKMVYSRISRSWLGRSTAGICAHSNHFGHILLSDYHANHWHVFSRRWLQTMRSVSLMHSKETLEHFMSFFVKDSIWTRRFSWRRLNLCTVSTMLLWDGTIFSHISGTTNDVKSTNIANTHTHICMYIYIYIYIYNWLRRMTIA